MREKPVCIVVDGRAERAYKVTNAEGERSAATVFGRPLEVGIGSIINFMPT